MRIRIENMGQRPLNPLEILWRTQTNSTGRNVYKGFKHGINMLEQNLDIKRTWKGKIVFYKSIKKVKKMGNGGHVLLPKELIGKEVKIVWEEE